MGFKFKRYAPGNVDADTDTPASLYKLAAKMVKKQLLKIEDVYVHLYPVSSSSLRLLSPAIFSRCPPLPPACVPADRPLGVCFFIILRRATPKRASTRHCA